MIKRCPTCRRDLPRENFAPSHWNKNGKQCRECHVGAQRRRSLRVNYGLTVDDVEAMYTRQCGRCLGCLHELPINYVIDHNHKTGQVRGLLCRACNFVLGQVQEDKSRLTRLRLYLDRDPSKTNIYIVGSLRNPTIVDISNKIRERGFIVWDEWISAGPEADDYWQKYEHAKGNTYQQALRGLAAQNVFHFDKGLIDLADIGIMVMPAGKSAHLELGYMSAQGKRTYVLQAGEPDRFDVMPQFATGVFTDVDTLLEVL